MFERSILVIIVYFVLLLPCFPQLVIPSLLVELELTSQHMHNNRKQRPPLDFPTLMIFKLLMYGVIIKYGDIANVLFK